MKNFLILIGLVLAFGAGYFISQKYDFKIETKNKERTSNSITTVPTIKKESLVGGDSDEHGCLGSAGYSWCEVKNKCLRTWEEKCERENDEDKIKTAILVKHGWNEEAVEINISKSNETFARGGIKEKQAVSGGMFLAKKINGTWEIVFEGNGVPDCNLLKATYLFPTDFLIGMCD